MAMTTKDHDQAALAARAPKTKKWDYAPSPEATDHVKPVAIWTSGSAQIKPVVTRLMDTWNNLPASATDRNSVVDWLDKHIQ